MKYLLLFVLVLFPLGPGAFASTAERTYIGEERCMQCHHVENEHWSQTVHAHVFRINPQNDLQRRTCEACHGPGSAHAASPADRTLLVTFTRDSATPVSEQNDVCLQCHKGRDLILWESSVHRVSELACSDCHNPMATISPSGLLRSASGNETCLKCHQKTAMEFRKRSHMPLPEGKLSCTDCHNPHGANTRALVKADTVNQLCYTCHAEKRGPFLWEHAPVRGNCLNCHFAHGSNHEKLLVVTKPFLCQQCHGQTTHPNDLFTRGNLATGARPDERILNRSCLNCHTQIHGSNHPSGVRLHR